MAHRWATVGEGRAAICAVLIVLTLVGAGLRVYRLDQGLWYDEIVTLLDSVRPPLSEILTTFSGDNHHPLYSLLAHFSVELFGEHAWSLRLPAVFFGTLSIPALYLLGRVLANKLEALLAAALLAFSYHHIWFSQNARGYTGLLFWTLLSTYLLLRGLQKSRRVEWIFYAAAAALGVYTHLTMVFVLVAHFLVGGWWAVTKWRPINQHPQQWRSILWGFGWAGVFSLLLYAPLLPQMVQFFLRPKGTIESEWMNPLWTIVETLRGLQVGLAAGLVGVLAAGVLFGSGLWSYAKENRFTLALLVIPGLFGAIVLVVMRHNIWPRFFFYSLGFMLLIAVRGAMVAGQLAVKWVRRPENQKRWADAVGTAFACVLILLSAFSLGLAYRYPKQDFVGAMRFVERERKPEEPVVTLGLTTLPYQRYYGKNWESAETLAQLESIRARGHKTWLLYTFPIHMESQHRDIVEVIARDFSVVEVFRGTIGGGDIYVGKSLR